MGVDTQRRDAAINRGPAPPEPASSPSRRDLLVALTVADLRFRYGRGPWRIARWLFDPFALVGVYLILVTVVLDRPGEAVGLSLACAVVPFQLLLNAVANALVAVGARRPILLNMRFPRMLIPLSSVLTETASFSASFLLLALMMAIYGIGPTLALLWLPAVVAVSTVLSIAFAYPAAMFGVWFREMTPFVLSFLRTLFFLAPGLVPLSDTGAADLLWINPLTGLFEAYREIFLRGSSPAAWQLLYPLGVALVLLAVVLPVYRREQLQFSKVIE